MNDEETEQGFTTVDNEFPNLIPVPHEYDDRFQKVIRVIPHDLVREDDVLQHLPFTKAEWTKLKRAASLPSWSFKFSGATFYRVKELQAWLADNYMERDYGDQFPTVFKLTYPASKVSVPPPFVLSEIPELRQMPEYEVHAGVYFLCEGDEVVYVGQSTEPLFRIQSHLRDQKKTFDRVYIVHCHSSELLSLESDFIKRLQPKYNNTHCLPRLRKQKAQLQTA